MASVCTRDQKHTHEKPTFKWHMAYFLYLPYLYLIIHIPSAYLTDLKYIKYPLSGCGSSFTADSPFELLDRKIRHQPFALDVFGLRWGKWVTLKHPWGRAGWTEGCVCVGGAGR